eukprot:Nitzschia sp. Nitz4//scaffold12_size214221//42409//45425//NITZ4_001486-RA/size214221-augustus-gene-0.25-mRNA-1//-1//CDS//3329534978//8086//frame0
MRRLSELIPEARAVGEQQNAFEFDMEVVRELEPHRRHSSRVNSWRVFPNSNEGSRAEASNSTSGLKRAELLPPVSDPTKRTDFLDNSERSSRSYGETTSSGGLSQLLPNRTISIALLVGLVGLCWSTLFLGFGIENAVDDERQQFNVVGDDFAFELQETIMQFVSASMWVHQACFLGSVTRQDFVGVYEYVSSYLQVEAVEWIPRVSHEDRALLEEEGEEYYTNEFPVLDYQGIVGYEGDGSTAIEYRSAQAFYQPVHYVQPIQDLNSDFVEFDLLSSPDHKAAIDLAFETWLPSATPATHWTLSTGGRSEDLYFRFLHPGIELTSLPNQTTQDLGSVAVRVKTLLEIASQNVRDDISVYIYDTTNEREPQFLLAAEVYAEGTGEVMADLVYLDPISIDEASASVFFTRIQNVSVASRTWTLVVIALEDTFEPNIGYLILAGKFILVASLTVSLWILTNWRRARTVLEIKRKSEMEKTAVIVRSARENAKAERELNDYIAHEVRNPLAAALSACTFVKASVNEKRPLVDAEAIESVREDVDIIDSSLTFAHDLLTSMLDMHRAVSKNVEIDEAPLDIKLDVVEPVVAMLYARGREFHVLTDCPEGLVVTSDRLRLKQILLNLSRNATRYVKEGFVRVGACEVNGIVQLFVEDSGYGISEDRKEHLFSKFQESLEVMDQGSGVGLRLCKTMTTLLGGDIWLDESYRSGIKDYPGSRFVVDLKKAPMFFGGKSSILRVNSDNGDDTAPTQAESALNEGFVSDTTINKTVNKPLSDSVPLQKSTMEAEVDAVESNPVQSERESEVEGEASTPEQDESDGLQELPQKLSVLFVDDDMILRKLFMRSLRKVVTTWNISEASSGEAALKLVDEKQFDIIFMDQYMASVEKQLLGTETTRALRSKGVSCRICGLSANDVNDGFWNAGADYFMFKPFPCKKEELESAILTVLNAPRNPKVQALSDSGEEY